MKYVCTGPNYDLPESLIARTPASPRDHSRLFIYDTARDTVAFDRFYNLPRHLPQDSFLVLNKTKVLPARLTVYKETGGKVTLLLLVNELQAGDSTIAALSDRRLIVGQKLFLQGNHIFTAAHQREKIFMLKPTFALRNLSRFLTSHGVMPLPPYLGGSPLPESQLRRKYQTVFAQNAGSIAAPTASLHFTRRVFNKLRRLGIPHFFVQLHVGLGTFAPLTEDNIRRRELFPEQYRIDATTYRKIRAAKRAGKKLYAVGTTTVRTLESAAHTKVLRGATKLFIMTPFDFRMIDGMITNFHLPNSSLMMLVEAFLQYKNAKRHLTELYAIAVREGFRFYSFGDAMLIM